MQRQFTGSANWSSGTFSYSEGLVRLPLCLGPIPYFSALSRCSLCSLSLSESSSACSFRPSMTGRIFSRVSIFALSSLKAESMRFQRLP